MVKIQNPDFSYWAWSTPWGQVLSKKTFCRIPVLFWKISCANFQLTKFVMSFKNVSGNLFSTCLHDIRYIIYKFHTWKYSLKDSGTYLEWFAPTEITPPRWQFLLSISRKFWDLYLPRECVSTGAAGAQTRRSLGHHLLHPLILRLLYYVHPLILRPTTLFYRTDCTRRSKFLTHTLETEKLIYYDFRRFCDCM